jgi:thiamine biosynthesis lipoprotein
MRRLIIPFLLLTVGFLHCARENICEETRFPMNTYVRIKVWGTSEDSLQKAVDESFAEIDRIDSLTSVFSPHSAVYALNKEGMIVSQEVAGLLSKALEVTRQSDGAFDPTVMPLIELWGFYDSSEIERTAPSAEEIEEALKLIGYETVVISGDTIKTYPKHVKDALQVEDVLRVLRVKNVLRDVLRNVLREMLRGVLRVDLSGIAKGYAVDRAVGMLQEQGVKKGIVDAGGDIRCFGEKKNGWSIGIRHPRQDDLLGIIHIDSGAVATSGDYENFFELDGIRYHHLIDPATGFPAQGTLSATVTAPTATQADAWATALFILGREGIALLEELEGLEGLIVTADEEILTTNGFPEIKEK